MSGSHYKDAALRLTKQMIDAERKYQEQKKYFDALTKAYIEETGDGLRILDQEARAAGDPRRQKAAADAAFFREEVNMYRGMAQLMLAMHQNYIKEMGH